MIKIGDLYRLITFNDVYIIVLKQEKNEVFYYSFKFKHYFKIDFDIFEKIYFPVDVVV